MPNKITIAIDAMGGENAPEKNINGLSLFIKSNNNLDKSLEFYCKLFLQDQILVKTDRLSMMHGLEVRSGRCHGHPHSNRQSIQLG